VVDQGEPTRLAAAVAELSLSYVVLTSVDRDDLKDGGASLFAEAIEKVKGLSPAVKVEALVPDFSGKEEALKAVAAAGADVIGHNLETVRRLTPQLRDRRAGYDLSLGVLNRFRVLAPRAITKSSLILGMGEQHEEILTALRDLYDVGVKAVTLGQYLQPTKGAAPVARYLLPEEFDELAEAAKEIGFRSVIAGPLVRSSYHAAKLFAECSG
jgi:lipoic acid synthetase